MTPPADHRSTLRALVEAGERAPDEDWFVKPRMGALPTVVYSGDYADEGEPNLIIEVVAEDEVGTASFIAQAANARPALAAIERLCWLDVEDAKLAESALISMGARWEFDPEGALPVAAKAAYEAADRLAREIAALAAAEATARAASGSQTARGPKVDTMMETVTATSRPTGAS